MRQLLVVGFAFLPAAPCYAQETTTLQYILAKGVVIHADLYGRPVDMGVTYNPDGTSTTKIVGAGGRGADLAGKWRIDGDKLCTVNAMNPQENCFDIPAGKKPGDTLKVMTPALGEATLTINQ
jgi:hypothetical protein